MVLSRERAGDLPGVGRFCLKWKSLSVSCSWMRRNWNGRLTSGSLWQRCTISCSVVVKSRTLCLLPDLSSYPQACLIRTGFAADPRYAREIIFLGRHWNTLVSSLRCWRKWPVRGRSGLLPPWPWLLLMNGWMDIWCMVKRFAFNA